MKAISYRRVSTDEQAENGYSLPSQSKEIEAYAKLNQIQLIADFYDDYTGIELDRPGLNQALKFLRDGNAKAIICLDSDRLTRQPIHYMLLRDEFQQQGIELHYTKRGPVNFDDFGAMLIEDFYGRFNKQWLDKIVENCTRGRRQSAIEGNVMSHGQAVYGYNLIKNQDNKWAFSINEDEAAIVRKIFDWYAYGDGSGLPLSIEKIRKRLSALRVPTRRDNKRQGQKVNGYGLWSRGVVHRMLRNETYIGQWYYNKTTRIKNSNGRKTIQIQKPRSEWIQVSVPKIVPLNTWKIVQDRLKKNKTKKMGQRRHKYLLTGRGTCYHCGQIMVGHTSSKIRKDGSKYSRYSYRCNNAYRKDLYVNNPCDYKKYFSGGKVDQTIWSWIKSYLLDKNKLEHGIRTYQKSQMEMLIPIQNDLDRTKKLLHKQEEKHQRLLDLYLAGALDVETYKDHQVDLEEKIQGLKIQVTILNDKLRVARINDDEINNLLAFASVMAEEFHDIEKNNDYEAKCELLNTLKVNVALEYRLSDQKKYVHISVLLDQACAVTLSPDS